MGSGVTRTETSDLEVVELTVGQGHPLTLAGLTLNGALGWWWADPLAALVFAYVAVSEGRDAWTGDVDCC